MPPGARRERPRGNDLEARLLAIDSEGGRLLPPETRNAGFLVSLLSLLDGPMEDDALIREARALGKQYAACGVTRYGCCRLPVRRVSKCSRPS